MVGLLSIVSLSWGAVWSLYPLLAWPCGFCSGRVVTVGRCLCSNVSLGLSQACVCSSCPSLALVSLTVLWRLCRLTDAGKFLPKV